VVIVGVDRREVLSKSGGLFRNVSCRPNTEEHHIDVVFVVMGIGYRVHGCVGVEGLAAREDSKKFKIIERIDQVLDGLTEVSIANDSSFDCHAFSCVNLRSWALSAVRMKAKSQARSSQAR